MIKNDEPSANSLEKINSSMENPNFPNYLEACENMKKKIEADGYVVLGAKEASVANSEWADMGFDKPPIAENTVAFTVEAGNHSYSRVFCEGVNNPMSVFIIRTDSIEGLTSEEIAEKLALPQIPNRIVDVNLPPTVPLEVSITGPQLEWHTLGGDIQYAIKDIDLNPEWFKSIRELH